MPADALVENTVGSLMSILTWWVDRRNRLTAPEADALFRRLTIPGLRQALSRSTVGRLACYGVSPTGRRGGSPCRLPRGHTS